MKNKPPQTIPEITLDEHANCPIYNYPKEFDQLCKELERVTRERDEAILERDKARRMYCDVISQNVSYGKSKTQKAEDLKWERFSK